MPLVRERMADILIRKRSFVHVEEYLTRHPDFVHALHARRGESNSSDTRLSAAARMSLCCRQMTLTTSQRACIPTCTAHCVPTRNKIQTTRPNPSSSSAGSARTLTRKRSLRSSRWSLEARASCESGPGPDFEAGMAGTGEG
jgi:hypothetical protein